MVYILIGFWTGETEEDWIYRSYSHIIWSQNRWRAGPAVEPQRPVSFDPLDGGA